MPLRDGFHTVTPYLTTNDVDGLVRFTRLVFGATETHRVDMGSGHYHVEVRIGDSMVMIGGGGGATPVTGMLLLYVDDVDATHAHAVKAGATSVRDPLDTPDGERRGGVQDPFGNLWYMGGPRSAKS